jgi:hypothetical protein
MNVTSIVSQLDEEIARLEEVKALLAGQAPKSRPGRPANKGLVAPRRKKRKLSPEGRARIIAAVKARWAKKKKSS